MALAGSPIGVYAPPDTAQEIDQQMQAQRAENQYRAATQQAMVENNQRALQQRLDDARGTFDEGLAGFTPTPAPSLDDFTQQAGDQYYSAMAQEMNTAGQPNARIAQPSPTATTAPTDGAVATGGGLPAPGSAEHGAVRATNAAVQAGADPDNLKWAKAHLSDQAYLNLCEKFVENASGTTGQYPTALAAANDYASKGQLKTDFENAQPGDKVYYGAHPENGGAGHAALLNDANTVVSSPSDQPTPLQGYFKGPLLGYVPQGQPADATQTQAPGTFAMQTSPEFQQYLDGLSATTADAGPSPSDQQTPVAQYNQQASDGGFQQVTKMASGDYNAQPADTPSADQQTVYDAQNAATHGFTSPDVGAPLLASGQTAQPATMPPTSEPDMPASQGQDVTSQSQPPEPSANPTAGTPPTQPEQAPPPQTSISSDQGTALDQAPQGQGGMDDVKATLSDLLHKAADVIGGANNAVVNATGPGTPLGKVLGSGEGAMPGQVPPLATDEQRAAMGEPPATAQQKEDDALIRATATSFPVVTGALGSIGKAATATEAVPAAVEDATAVSRVGADGRAGQELAATPPPGYEAKPVAGVVVDSAGKPAAGATVSAPSAVAGAASDFVEAAAQPAMGGGAAGANPVIDSLNGLIGTMQDGVKAAPTPQAAITATSMADSATLALTKGLDDAYTALKLTPTDAQHVADVLEGLPASVTGGVSQKAIDAADALKQTTDATASMAQKAGVIRETVENYFTHMVRVPAAETTAGNGITPGVLSEWSRFAQGRARDAAGNVLMPTLRDLQDYVAAEHPTWQVVTDVPTLVAAHVRSLVTASNHAALGDILVAATDAAGNPLLSAIQRKGDVPVNLPSSLSRWLYRGTTPEEGAVAITRGGVAGGSPEGQAVVEKMPLLWAQPDMAKMLNRYAASDLIPPNALGPIGQKLGALYDKINGGIVSNKLLNLLVHGENLASEASQYLDPRQAAGLMADRAATRAVMSDPVAMTKLLQEAPLNLPQIRSFARELAQRTGNIQDAGRNIPVLSGLGNAADKVATTNHELLFNQLGQRLQLQSYFGARRQGMDAQTAARYANAKFGQFSPQDLNAFTRWVNAHVAFAGSWLTGRMLQYGSLLGKSGYGGYAADLSPAAQKTLANSLRGDFLKGTALLVGGHAMANQALGGKWPWENAPGRLTDVNIDRIAPGQYLTDPFFRGSQDLLKFLTAPITTQGTATQRMAGSVAVAGNKLAPLLGMARNQIAGEQYAGGPAIMGAKDDPGQQLKDELGFLAAQILPGGEHINAALNPRVKVGDSGIVGTLTNVRSVGTPGKTTTSTGAPKAPAGVRPPTAPRR